MHRRPRHSCFASSTISASTRSTPVIWITPGGSRPEPRLTARTLKPPLSAALSPKPIGPGSPNTAPNRKPISGGQWPRRNRQAARTITATRRRCYPMTTSSFPSTTENKTPMSTDSQKLRGKVAIVTGASKGIGAAIATHLGHAGASVVVNYSSSKEGADRVVADITSNGGKAIAVQANVAQKADIDRLFAETMTAFGRVDVLINNAGIYDFK